MEIDSIFLLIEDNVIDQIVTTQLLKKKLGIPEVNIANNGKEGIQWLHNNRNRFNQSLIILLDIQMPEMNGFEFLHEYEKLPQELKRETQLFMLSSTLDSNEIKRAKDNSHVIKLLSKPLPVKELEMMIVAEY
jgi:CheY-like chemotaxis protein